MGGEGEVHSVALSVEINRSMSKEGREGGREGGKNEKPSKLTPLFLSTIITLLDYYNHVRR